MFLLFKHRYVTLGVFLCPSAPRPEPTWISDDAGGGNSDMIRQNFDNFVWAHPYDSMLSYSIATPYPFDFVAWYDNLTVKPKHERPDPADAYRPPPHQPPDFALAADANRPFGHQMLQPYRPVRPDDPFSIIRLFNSRNHNGEGQNVLYMDGHVSWQTTMFCGHEGDNIYTGGRWDPEKPGSGDNPNFPCYRNDSLLLPGRHSAGW
jgi:prepilin-type processing-associated H-X9-DG protein